MRSGGGFVLICAAIIDDARLVLHCTLTNRNGRALPPISFQDRTSPFIALPTKDCNRRILTLRAASPEEPLSTDTVEVELPFCDRLISGARAERKDG